MQFEPPHIVFSGVPQRLPVVFRRWNVSHWRCFWSIAIPRAFKITNAVVLESGKKVGGEQYDAGGAVVTILFWRPKGAYNHEGNVQFRTIVRERSVSYINDGEQIVSDSSGAGGDQTSRGQRGYSCGPLDQSQAWESLTDSMYRLSAPDTCSRQSETNFARYVCGNTTKSKDNQEHNKMVTHQKTKKQRT